MFTEKPPKCPITNDTEFKKIHSYSAPPIGETSFPLKKDSRYSRELWQFFPSRHFISIVSMEIDTNYEGAYVEATYKDYENLKSTFKKIISLPIEKSDNTGRVNAIQKFSGNWFCKKHKPNLLDIGSGLGVFPYAIKKLGWECLAIDPDKIATKHIVEDLGMDSLCGDFLSLKPTKKFEIITLNKVLEHVLNPIEILKNTHNWLSDRGFVYIEIPDGEAAICDGPEREEFFVEHIHIFSIPSTIALANRAGYLVDNISRIKEPSGKYTIRAYLFPMTSLKLFINK